MHKSQHWLFREVIALKMTHVGIPIHVCGNDDLNRLQSAGSQYYADVRPKESCQAYNVSTCTTKQTPPPFFLEWFIIVMKH